ncbi:hypothetical protein TWF569_011328 [Orbilia oligospora]|uniref:Cyclin-like protein n=2 Tax=Orbilia oligospora TaxID=2813651 RepID=A0A7C8JN50_ORBOL|nr:hypothetical protein TWF706_002733 [Orbilia oligospora]KAF3097588.1 hypothetical protein TWF103_009519 [Orbilia oligospora]KAF3098123.1 hypothetical protein TWF102_006114 [Orbilia oligospora]KAF3132785.1 hypothetical protein TWF703_007251 [Orbilia oligospora]KAF3151406.1 hypothetical protein TWF594_007053 [Orbilia oligospora]
MTSRVVASGVAHSTPASSSNHRHLFVPQAARANPSFVASSKGVNSTSNCSPSAVPVRLLLSSIMPSFYARPPPGLPITPPESMYYHQYGMYGMHDQKSGFDSYNQMQQYHPGYRQQSLQFPPGLAHPSNCNTLPPLNGMKSDENMQLPWNTRNDAKSAPAKSEEKPTGGVAQVLDYEIEDMAEFVTSMAIGIILPGSQSQQTVSAFKKFVFTILQSTRLPSSTVILSLDYLSHRMNNCPPTTQHKGLAHLYRMCTISLLLASKFLDDNTFQNRSWADVTGLQVTELNQLEADWLAAIGWQLHVARPGYTGFDSWKASWDSFISQKQVHHAPVLTPINTNIMNNRRHTMSFTNQTFSPQQQHPQSALPHGYIGDHLRQSQMNDGAYWCPDLTSSAQPSPPSLASSGPTTPAWEYPMNNWGHHFGGKHQFPARVSPSRISPPLLMQGFKGGCNCVSCFHTRLPQLPTPPSMYPNFAVGYGHQIVA